jgi:hypothetical protein
LFCSCRDFTRCSENDLRRLFLRFLTVWNDRLRPNGAEAPNAKGTHRRRRLKVCWK